MYKYFLFSVRTVFSTILMLLPYIGCTQTTLIPAGVYRWNSTPVAGKTTS